MCQSCAHVECCCVVNTLSGQCVLPVKCMSLIMYYVITSKYSEFNDLELVFGFGITQETSESRCLLLNLQ